MRQPLRDTPVTTPVTRHAQRPQPLPARTRGERLDNWLALLALLAGSILLGGGS